MSSFFKHCIPSQFQILNRQYLFSKTSKKSIEQDYYFLRQDQTELHVVMKKSNKCENINKYITDMSRNGRI